MGISTEMLVCEDMISCTDLARRHVVGEIATSCHCLPNNSYYTIVASVFLVTAEAIYVE